MRCNGLIGSYGTLAAEVLAPCQLSLLVFDTMQGRQIRGVVKHSGVPSIDRMRPILLAGKSISIEEGTTSPPSSRNPFRAMPLVQACSEHRCVEFAMSRVQQQRSITRPSHAFDLAQERMDHDM